MNRQADHNQTIVINATNLGKLLDGIGVYTLNLLKELSRLSGDTCLIIYVNRSCREHLHEIAFSEKCEIRWVSRFISPDLRFKGHLLRLLYAQFIALRHRHALIFATSQLEAAFVPSHQVITIHDLIPLLFKRCHKKQYPYYRCVLGFALRRAIAIITPSNHTKELLQEWYDLPADRIHAIHNGRGQYGADGSSEEASSKPPFILYTGRIVKMKNIAGVLNAFALIRNRIPHQLVITGHGRGATKRRPDSTRFSEEGCLDNERVVYEGYVSTEEMRGLMRKASLLIFPSFYEGFGLPPLEAMACGCPTVVSNVASLPEVCGDASYYVDPSSMGSIAEGMYRVLSDQALREVLVERGRQRARQFSWEKSARQHLEILIRCLTEHRVVAQPVDFVRSPMSGHQPHRPLPGLLGSMQRSIH